MGEGIPGLRGECLSVSTRRLSVGAPLFNQWPMPWAGRAGTRVTISMHLRRDGSWPIVLLRKDKAEPARLPASTKCSSGKAVQPFFCSAAVEPIAPQQRSRSGADPLDSGRPRSQPVGGAGARSLSRHSWAGLVRRAARPPPYWSRNMRACSLLDQVQERSRTLHRRCARDSWRRQ